MNHFFQFKEFIIKQDKTAMKVTTDACLFGAWAAACLKEAVIGSILDIGTGTGLLSLMLAQKVDATFDAVEIDEQAADQATENFAESVWKDRLTVHHMDVTEFDRSRRYDFIISNPPFFEGDLLSSDKKKNAAKHDASLTLKQLLQTVGQHLKPDGFFAILLPHHRTGDLTAFAEKANLYLAQQTLVKQTPTHEFFRTMSLFGKKTSSVINAEIIIKGEDGNYTEAFISLLKPYYLYL